MNQEHIPVPKERKYSENNRDISKVTEVRLQGFPLAKLGIRQISKQITAITNYNP